MLVAATAVGSVVVLAVSLRRVCAETDLLRQSLRRARAAGVANDDLAHLIGALAARLNRHTAAGTMRRIGSRRGQGAR